MSGSPFEEAKEEALANGAFAFFPKPVALAELDRFVVVALESRKAKRSCDAHTALTARSIHLTLLTRLYASTDAAGGVGGATAGQRASTGGAARNPRSGSIRREIDGAAVAVLSPRSAIVPAKELPRTHRTLARAWTAMDLRGAVMRQAAVLELLADESRMASESIMQPASRDPKPENIGHATEGAYLPGASVSPPISNWSFERVASQASHVSPLLGPLQTLPMPSCGRRRSWSLPRMRRRRDSWSSGLAGSSGPQEAGWRRLGAVLRDMTSRRARCFANSAPSAFRIRRPDASGSC